jgi:hypothetical protein
MRSAPTSNIGQAGTLGFMALQSNVRRPKQHRSPHHTRTNIHARITHTHRYGEIDTDDSKTIELEEFIQYFCAKGSRELPKEPAPEKPRLAIEDTRWTHASSVMSHPPPYEAKFTITNPQPGLNTGIVPSLKPYRPAGPGGPGLPGPSRPGFRDLDGEHVLVPPTEMDALGERDVANLDVDEAQALFWELSNGSEREPNTTLSHEELSWALRMHPAAADRLAGQRVGVDEFVYFFTGKMRRGHSGARTSTALVVYQAREEEFVWKKPSLSAQEVRAMFDQMDSVGKGTLTHAELIKALKKYPDIARKLGFPTMVREEDGSRVIYQLLFGAIDRKDRKGLRFVLRVVFGCDFDCDCDGDFVCDVLVSKARTRGHQTYTYVRIHTQQHETNTHLREQKHTQTQFPARTLHTCRLPHKTHRQTSHLLPHQNTCRHALEQTNTHKHSPLTTSPTYTKTRTQIHKNACKCTRFGHILLLPPHDMYTDTHSHT